MELKKDLLKMEQKSVFRIILGILFFVISIIWIVDRIFNNQIIRPFDWFYSGIFALNGIVHSIEGFGFSFARLFGKAYIIVDNVQISIKPRLFEKEQNIYWNDIKLIEYKLNKFQVIKLDETTLTLDLSKLDYSLKKEIRETIEYIAKEKQILFS